MHVPLVNTQLENAPLRAEIDAAVKRVLDSGRFILGPEVEALENELAVFAGAAHCVTVSSGSDALFLALNVLKQNTRRAHRVATTPFTFVATVEAILRNRLEPTFFDIDDDMLMKPVEYNDLLQIPVSLFGHPYEVMMPGRTVYDNAQALNTGCHQGALSTTSFFPTKNLGGIGDGGAIFTNHTDYAEILKKLRNHGVESDKATHTHFGGNYRLDEIQAAVLRVKLKKLPAWNSARSYNAYEYRRLFAQSKVAGVIRVPAYHPLHCYHHFVIRVPKRDELKTYLEQHGVGCGVYYSKPVHLQPAFSHLEYRPGDLPAAEKAATEVLALPIRPTLTDKEIGYVVGRVEDFYGK